MRFLFRTRHEVGLPPSVAQALAETYSELRAAVDAKAAEGKKPSKGSQAAAAAEEALIDEAVFTPAFCQTLPADLLRRCVSAQVNLQPSCRRRGFVLDVWDGKVVTGLETAQEALNFFSLLPGGKAGEGIELVVELHVSELMSELANAHLMFVRLCSSIVPGHAADGEVGSHPRGTSQVEGGARRGEGA